MDLAVFTAAVFRAFDALEREGRLLRGDLVRSRGTCCVLIVSFEIDLVTDTPSAGFTAVPGDPLSVWDGDMPRDLASEDERSTEDWGFFSSNGQSWVMIASFLGSSPTITSHEKMSLSRTTTPSLPRMRSSTHPASSAARLPVPVMSRSDSAFSSSAVRFPGPCTAEVNEMSLRTRNPRELHSTATSQGLR